MDIFDISSLEPPYVGQVKQVKVLGGLAMIDVRCEQELSEWKNTNCSQGQHYRLEGSCCRHQGPALEIRQQYVYQHQVTLHATQLTIPSP